MTVQLWEAVDMGLLQAPSNATDGKGYYDLSLNATVEVLLPQANVNVTDDGAYAGGGMPLHARETAAAHVHERRRR